MGKSFGEGKDLSSRSSRRGMSPKKFGKRRKEKKVKTRFIKWERRSAEELKRRGTPSKAWKKGNC